MRNKAAGMLVIVLITAGLFISATVGLAAEELSYAVRLGDDLSFIELEEGQKITLLLVADDGAQCIAMPTGAIYDAVAKKLTWIPDFDQKGIHSIVFIGTIDGREEASFVSITVHNLDWTPDAGTAKCDPSYIWPPNNKFVQVNIVLPDPLGKQVPITIDGVTVIDTIRNEKVEETKKIAKGNAYGIQKEVKLSYTQRILSGRKGADFQIKDGVLYLLATRPGFLSERIYVIAFTATHPKTGMSSSGTVSIPVLHDMSDMKPAIDGEEMPLAETEAETGKGREKDKGGKPEGKPEK
jgi:hypothetical protein